MTSLRLRDGWRELRLNALTDAATHALVEGDFTAAMTTDLRGNRGEPLPVHDGLLRLPLRAWEIRTLRLR